MSYLTSFDILFLFPQQLQSASQSRDDRDGRRQRRLFLLLLYSCDRVFLPDGGQLPDRREDSFGRRLHGRRRSTGARLSGALVQIHTKSRLGCGYYIQVCGMGFLSF